MSYCRFSSDNYKSDVYVYITDYGYCIELASGRIIAEVLPPPSRELPLQEWMLLHKERSLFLFNAPREEIDLPHAGEKLFFSTLRILYDELLMLRTMGYRVPQSALDAIQKDMEKEDERERLSASGVDQAR